MSSTWNELAAVGSGSGISTATAQRLYKSISEVSQNSAGASENSCQDQPEELGPAALGGAPALETGLPGENDGDSILDWFDSDEDSEPANQNENRRSENPPPVVAKDDGFPRPVDGLSEDSAEPCQIFCHGQPEGIVPGVVGAAPAGEIALAGNNAPFGEDPEFDGFRWDEDPEPVVGAPSEPSPVEIPPVEAEDENDAESSLPGNGMSQDSCQSLPEIAPEPTAVAPGGDAGIQAEDGSSADDLKFSQLPNSNDLEPVAEVSTKRDTIKVLRPAKQKTSSEDEFPLPVNGRPPGPCRRCGGNRWRLAVTGRCVCENCHPLPQY